MTDLSFPIYRKYANESSFFRISSPDYFEELKIFGSRYSLHELKATILPDRVFISDMIDLKDGMWLESSEQEFNHQLAHSQNELKRVP